MTTLPVCRVCLARNTKMHIISNPLLEAIFEMISGIKFITGDGKPDSVCYICFAMLQKCWRFQEKARSTDKLLNEIINNGCRFTPAKISMLHGVSPNNLTMSAMKCISMPEYIKNEIEEEIIKEEIIGFQEKISIEVQPEGDPVSMIPIEYGLKPNSLKQELNSSEFESEFESSSDISCLLSLSLNEPAKSLKEHRYNSKTRRKEQNPTLNMGITKKKLFYSCDKCNKRFKQTDNLKKHMKTHIDVKPISCDECIETFSNKTDLQEHMLQHTKQKMHFCDICGKAFLSKYSLKNHVTLKHMKTHTIKTHDCDRCNKSFNHRGTLRLHMRIHTGDKPYACDKCSKTFSQKGALQRHMRIHTGERPFACHRCTKTFNQESSLKRHINMHTGEKSYTCTRCGKAYYESSHLTRHIRTHTGEKPYACDRCFQTFSQSSNLQAHMKKHTGEKATNYKCYECNKTFDHKSIFKRHLLIHTQEKPYPCDKCDKKYADKRSLQRHIVTHNN